jgi:chromosome segregation ATPase
MNDTKKTDISLLTQLREENIRLSKRIDEYFGDKAFLEKKLYKIQQSFEDRMSYDRETIEKLNDKLFIVENKLKEKENSEKLTKAELLKYITNENLKKFRHVFVVDPSKANIDLNNELNYTRDILAKISKLMNTEKTRSENMQSQITNLQDELNLYRKNNKAFMIDCLANNIKLGRLFLNLDSLRDEDFSDEEAVEFDIEDDEETNLDSPSLKFPDKVSIGMSMNSNISGKTVPKLDFTKVTAKYKSNNMKVDLKDIKIKETDKFSDYSTVNKMVTLKDDDKPFARENSKLKGDLNLAQKINEKLKQKLEKYKQSYKELKDKFLKLGNTLKLAQNKIEVLETHVKKGLTNIPSTEDTVNKRNLNNTSMVGIVPKIECQHKCERRSIFSIRGG